MLRAYASRRVSGDSPKRYSMSLRIDSKANTSWLTNRRRAYGETATAGMRIPSCP
jgi:hypothetical protein